MDLGNLAKSGVAFYAITKPLDDAMRNLKSKLAAFSLTAIATASFKATGAAASLAMEMHRIDTIFGRFGPQIEDTITRLSKAFGYTRAELGDMSANLGLMFVGMNLNEKATADLAKRFLQLGVNASVLHGMDLPEFMERIDAGVAGANRSLRKMGIFITEASKDWEKYRLAGSGVMWMTDEQGDQMARLSLIMKHLAGSAGQAEWAHKQFGGTLREVKGRISELWIAFGEISKPIWTEAIRGINWALQQLGDWIDRNKDKFINFTTNIRIYAQIMGLSIMEAMQKAGVYFGYFLDVAGAGIVWLQKNWRSAMFDIGNMAKTAFVNVATNIMAFGGWLGREWRNLWDDLGNVVRTTLTNLGANFKTFGQAAYNWIKSGFRDPFEFKMIGLGQGAAPAKAGALPDMAGILDGFKALADKFAMPGLPVAKLKEINDEFAKRIADLKKQMVPGAKIGGEQGGGIARPGATPTRIEPGFVGITEFAKQIQTGALSQEAAAIATARHTQRIAQMMEMFGPRLMDIFLAAGGAIP